MLRRLLLFINVAVLVAFVLACMSCYISPAVAWPLAFLGLGFPVIVLCVLPFLLLWAIWRQPFFWVNVVILLLCIPFIRTVANLPHQAEPVRGIKLMSYNVRNFDLYNWTNNSRTRQRIMQLIASESPDIICFQEFYTDQGDFPNVAYLRDSLGYRYHYLHVTHDLLYTDRERRSTYHMQWGLAVFSRYEIRDTGVVAFAETAGNQCIYADLSVEGQSLRVYTAHLQSIHLANDDYDTIEELSEQQSSNWYRIKNVLRKIKHAYTLRAAQARAVHAHVSSYPGRKVVCGDFNDSPVSYTYQTISSGLQDAFVQRGGGFGQTYSTRVGLFRIDYILPDPSIHVLSCRTIHKELSDHYPVVVRLSF